MAPSEDVPPYSDPRPEDDQHLLESGRRFPNVPMELRRWVRYGMHEYPSNRDFIYLQAAGGVVSQYLHRNFLGPDTTDPLARTKIQNEKGEVGHLEVHRASLIGEALFQMRSCSGFDEMCRRLNRELRSAYFEILIAKGFFKAGFDIEARPETGVRGKDFDFAARRGDGLFVNVEVTALDDQPFNEATLKNAFNHKRTQLPDTVPGVVVCVLPTKWAAQSPDINKWADSIATRLLRGTRRVNCLALPMEVPHDSTADGTRGNLFVIVRQYQNKNPRHPCDVGFVFETPPHLLGLDAESRTATAAGDIAKMDAIAIRSRVGREFFEWVDHLVPPGHKGAEGSYAVTPEA